MLKGVAETALAPLRGFFGYFGDSSLLLFQLFMRALRRSGELFLEQMHFVGVGSLPIIMLVGLFSGAVAAQQAIKRAGDLQSGALRGRHGRPVVAQAAPAFTALMITARAGSGMADGNLLDAHHRADRRAQHLRGEPDQHLITPRILATIIMMPVMTMVFNIVGLGGRASIRSSSSRSTSASSSRTSPSGPIRRTTSSAAPRRRCSGYLAVADLRPGLQRPRWRQGGRPGDDARGGVGVGVGARARLLPDRHLPYPA